MSSHGANDITHVNHFYCLSLSINVLSSWILLIDLRYDAAAVSADLSIDWLHHGLEDEGL